MYFLIFTNYRKYRYNELIGLSPTESCQAAPPDADYSPSSSPELPSPSPSSASDSSSSSCSLVISKLISTATLATSGRDRSLPTAAARARVSSVARATAASPTGNSKHCTQFSLPFLAFATTIFSTGASSPAAKEFPAGPSLARLAPEGGGAFSTPAGLWLIQMFTRTVLFFCFVF
ncbi:hypothetical protein T492DRAFT_358268 [Pavlovales sp. CCMP2436]|nr:hypothetical protein T492DRAFT_358268 [Pavlovales sp. CCMP2436]